MHILWHSNSPTAPTGYGNQTRLFMSRIAEDYGLTLSSFYGIEGAARKHGEIVELPRWNDSYGNDIIDVHAQWSKADAVVSLVDPFPLSAPAWGRLNWWSWVPVDSSPLTMQNKLALKQARGMWSMSRFGHQVLVEAFGEDMVDYVPHGIDTQAYQIRDRGTARRRMGEALHRDDLDGRYLVVTVAANKGVPARKNFWGMFEAFAGFLRVEPDALFYVHTNPTTPDGENLRLMAKAAGIQDAVIFPAEYNYMMGMISQDHLCDVYNSADVFMLLSYGEGFGLPVVEAQASGCPVIVTNGSAMTELVFAGRTVRSRKAQAVGRYNSEWREACIEDATLALCESRSWDEAQRKQARMGAMAYDVDKVYTAHMKPALEKIKAQVKPAGKPTKKAQPDVSLVIPTRNGAATIRRAVESARGIPGLDVEVVVVNDGSTDGTKAILDEMRCERVRVVHQAPLGQMTALVTAVQCATGRYIAYHGDDDWLDVGLVDLVETLDEADADVMFAYGPQQYHGASSRFVIPQAFNAGQLWHNNYPLNANLVRREVFSEHGMMYYRPSTEFVYPEDWDLLLQIVDAGYRGQKADTRRTVLNYTLSHNREWAKMQTQREQVLKALRERWPKMKAAAI